MKQLITAFGFIWWDAPGEAEAECAALQKRGLVDLVITEDVDSFMFGATVVAREIADKKRTHVNVYSNVEERTGLGRNELVLCAMMSGGDYLPAGIPNCGPKISATVIFFFFPSLSVDCQSGVCYLLCKYKGLRKVEGGIV